MKGRYPSVDCELDILDRLVGPYFYMKKVSNIALYISLQLSYIVSLVVALSSYIVSLVQRQHICILESCSIIACLKIGEDRYYDISI